MRRGRSKIIKKRVRYLPALANGHGITLLDIKSWGAVSRDVGVSLLITLVLGDVVEVRSADDDGSLHLTSRNHGSTEDASSLSNNSVRGCGNSAVQYMKKKKKRKW